MAIPFIKEVGAVMEMSRTNEVDLERLLLKCLVHECQLVSYSQFCPAHRDEEAEECDACGEMKHEKGGEGIVAYTHRVDGQAVGQDREWICAQCVALRDDHFEEPDYDYYPPEYDHRYYEEK